MYGEIAPLGHVLRSFYPEIWTRFHSLPESKRYPESPAEVKEVVRRATKVARVLFEDGEAINIYKSRFHFEDDISPFTQEIAGSFTGIESVLFRANPGVVASEDDDIFRTWALESSWQPAFFEELIRQVADEREMHVCLVSPKTGNMFCPYDGGIDIFTPSKQVVDLLQPFSSWRSKRSDGL